MVQSIALFIFTICITFVFYTKWRSSNRKADEDVFAKQHGCLPINKVFSGRLPLGLDLVKGLYTANANHHLMLFLQPFVDELDNNFELRLLGNAGLVTTDPENIRAVLSKSKIREGELDFGFGERRDALLPLFGDGIFTQDGAAWKHSRDMLRKQFARIQYHNLDNFTEHVELLISRLSNMKSSPVDLHPLFCNFTLDTTTSLLFGESAGTLREETEDAFGENLSTASWFSAIRVQLAYLYWLCSLPQYFKACNQVKMYADQWVKKALDKSEDVYDRSGQYELIRSLYNEYKDRRLVREQLVNVLLAGRDTTACLLSWTFRLLVRHREVLERLRQEIEAVQGADTLITKAKLQKMPHLKNIITETLRLYPPVPVNFREASQTTVLPRGGGPDGRSPILVPAGMGLGYSPYFMHRRKDLYGEDAFSFRPERWADGSLQEQIGWGYLPFNAGPRVCLGQEFALLEASYAIVRIVQSFPTISLPADETLEPIGAERQSITLTMAPGDGCRVDLR